MYAAISWVAFIVAIVGPFIVGILVLLKDGE